MILAVFVTYYPDKSLLEQSVNSIKDQVGKVLVIDNGSFADVDYAFIYSYNVRIIKLSKNIGIAGAQNIGLRIAIEEGFSYAMLSDQDTIYPEQYVMRMLPVFETDPLVAAVVPKFIDIHKVKRDGFVAINPFFFNYIYPESGCHPILQGIASGKIISLRALHEIGYMNEALFIDWVDFEWCWRARKRGYQIIGNANVLIEHRLGDTSIDCGFKEVNLRSPLRHYYITRNAFYLALHSNSLDLGHRINLFFKSFRYVFGYPLLSKPRGENFKAVMLGFWHGVCGKLKKCTYNIN